MDTERLWVAAAEAVMRRQGHPLTHAEALALVYGRAWHDIRDDVLARYPAAFASVEELERLLGEAFEALKRQCDVRIDSSIALLRELSASHPVAVVSGSSRRVVGELMRLGGFEDCVRFFLGTEDVPRGKPDPAPYLLAAERLGLPPASCLAFEDSEAGVRSAKSAGMRVVALRRDGAPPQDFSQADLVLADLAAFRLDRLD